MPIVKAKCTHDFTVIPNDAIDNKNLSFEARGVLHLLLRMPEDWHVRKSWLVDQCPMTGKDKMTRILKELEQERYLVKQKKRDDTGRFDSYDWMVYQRPYTESGSAVHGDDLLTNDGGLPVNGSSAPTKYLNKLNTHHQEEKIPYSSIQEVWNEILGSELGKLRSITSGRRRSIKARVSEDSKRLSAEWWKKYFLAITDMPHLMGMSAPNPQTGKPWKANFDWLINETNMTKVLEKRYVQQ